MLNNDSLSKEFWNSLIKLGRGRDLSSLKNNILILVFFKYISNRNKVDDNFEIHVQDQFDFPQLLKINDFIELNFEITNRLNNISIANPILNGILNFVDFKSNSDNLGSTENELIFLRSLLILIDRFGDNLDISIEENNSVWTDLFNYLVKSFEETSTNSATNISTPDNINDLICRLIVDYDNTCCIVNDPTCNSGNLFVSFSKIFSNKTEFFGEDINAHNVFFTKLNLIINGLTNFHIEQRDVLNKPVFLEQSNEIKKFDYVVQNFPLNKRLWNFIKGHDYYNRWNSKTSIPPSNNPVYAYLLHIIKSLKENGTAACVVTNDNLYRGDASEKNIRKYIIENGYLKGIIGLPSNLYYSTTVPTSIIILENKPIQNNKDVFMINASSEFETSKFSFLNKLSFQNVDRIVDVWSNQKELNEFSLLVSYDDIVENDYNLNISRYLTNLDEFKIPQGSKIVELSSLLNSVPKTKAKNESGKLIKISDLSNDTFLYDIDLDSLQFSEAKANFLKLDTPALLISKVLNKLKPSFCKATKNTPILISPEIEAFIIIDNSIDLSYLITQLNSDFVIKQAEMYSQGSIIPRLTLQNILKLKIIVPDMDLQNSLVRQKALVEGAKIQSDKDKIESLQLQSTIDTLLKERMNDFQWTLHDLRNGDLLSIKNKISVLQKLSKIDERANDIIVDSNNNVTLISFINKLADNVINLSNILSEMFDDTDDFGSKERLNLIDLVNDFIKDQQVIEKSCFYFNINDLNDLSDELEERNKMYIEFNRKDFIKICNNIFENIKRHAGFFDESNEYNNIIKLSIDLDKKKQMISFSFLNTGNENNISQSDYFSNGGRKGINGNSGKGGFIIKELALRNNAKAFQNSFEMNKINDFAFEVGLTVKYFLNEI